MGFFNRKKSSSEIVRVTGNEPVPLNDSGRINLNEVTAILIIGVEDYHGK